MSAPIKVLLVCMGNICRSPMAEGMLAHQHQRSGVDFELELDSAATHPYQVGRAPDDQAQAVALSRSVDISALRARVVTAEDFQSFDYVLAMDRDNLQMLRYICPGSRQQVLHLFMEFAAQADTLDIPDPYGADDDAFEHALDLIELAVAGFLEHLHREHG